ncbi:CRISPR-associated endonuclease/helicase Cas3 [Enhygromyxa salina]|uniref:CRISPR-associated endonuclease/helicase Cas3 n=1 Tax=Enhygromyxa salina TaxID=215803 RepID=A0A2S9YDY7_9BACT|nr:type I-U CRISPR-associated helicase/endonuclease Cas3 [Enhygromyxa salina]PRQ03337.1 CRISPR-associated endonuclease/helicase Cas3 [Enhygromyxa salina]
MPELSPKDFDAFMREVTGFTPFPWQRRLLTRVLDSGWPALLDLPTGTGKTSALLVALYVLALDPERSARRIALVVDRRIIVDQVDGFARKVREALCDRERPTCAKVGARLRELSASAGADPVRVVHLRGGIPRDDTWLSAPDQPTLISSTVDQVGSRLLFRGYGVSECMRPVHAGLLASDTLYFLDEVHLATAFEETLMCLRETYSKWPERGGTGRPFQVVRMSATLRSGLQSKDVFGLSEDDHADPVLARRLGVSRRAALELVKTKRASTPAARAGNRSLIAEAACRRARAAAKAGATAIGVVVNRVDTARRAAARLRELDEGEVLLLTGRMRPYERSAIQDALEATAAAGVDRPADARPTFVVATSCIEAGADLDFDALVTEVASLDAVRQRFGRLNRLGNYETAPAWVLAARDQLGKTAEPDPVYGEALRATWDYLGEIAESRDKQQQVEFGLSSFVEPSEERRAKLLPKRNEAPVLFPSYLDMWSETRPAPHPDPDPALWLHGKEAREERDVSLIFRADLCEECDGSEEQTAQVRDALEFLPPLADEAVSVPLRQLQAWLGEDARAWRWSSEGVEAVPVDELRAGATVIVPASRGGLGAGTWDPSATQAVDDVAERATHAGRELAKLRLDPQTLPNALAASVPRPVESDDPEEVEAARLECLAWLTKLADKLDEVPADWRPVLAQISDPKARRVLLVAELKKGERIWRVAVAPPKRALEATTEDAVSVFSGVEVSLASHLEDVRAWAASFARAAGLDPKIAEDVALAGLVHDLGKADLRFQALLRGGDPIRAVAGEPLAKSRQFGSASGRERAARRSGWPRGLRHELVSLALFDASDALRERAHDVDLVRHLIASHHGWCRPWAPTTVDPEPKIVSFEVAGIRAEVSTAALDDEFLNACASRFRRLCRRYGWHGLAYLEALLRLGDHRASREPGARPGAES